MLFKAEKNTYQVKQGYEKLKSDQEMSDHSKHQTQKPMLRIPSKNARDQKTSFFFSFSTFMREERIPR